MKRLVNGINGLFFFKAKILCLWLCFADYVQKKPFALSSCREIARIIVILALNSRSQFKIYRSFSHEYYKSILDLRPLLPFKYIGSYLIDGLSTAKKKQALVFHYEYVKKVFGCEFYAALTRASCLLFEKQLMSQAITVQFVPTHPQDREGDLAIELRGDDQFVYLFGFSFVPGSICGFEKSGTTMLVSRIQGVKNPDFVRVITKGAGDISPPYLLLRILLGIAEALNIKTIAGVSDQTQLSRHKFGYDRFWASLGATLTQEGVHRLNLPNDYRSLNEFASKHRGRVREKRHIKNDITNSTRAVILQMVDDVRDRRRRKHDLAPEKRTP